MNWEAQLGKRLGLIANQLVLQNQFDAYDEIWDCCCDHGYLGLALLTRQSEITARLNFVDQVPHITQQLHQTLKHITPHRYRIFTQDAGSLTFEKQQRHCVIIAGVTTTGIIKLLNSLLPRHAEQSFDLILCPTRETFELRRYLAKQPLYLLRENHVSENGRHYEVIMLRHNHNPLKREAQISAIGEFWEENNLDQLDYLHSRLKHYQSALNGKANKDASEAVALYSNLLKKPR